MSGRANTSVCSMSTQAPPAAVQGLTKVRKMPFIGLFWFFLRLWNVDRDTILMIVQEFRLCVSPHDKLWL